MTQIDVFIRSCGYVALLAYKMRHSNDIGLAMSDLGAVASSNVNSGRKNNFNFGRIFGYDQTYKMDFGLNFGNSYSGLSLKRNPSMNITSLRIQAL